MKPIFAVTAAIVFAILAPGFSLAADQTRAIEIEQPWARASVLKSRPAAAYFTILNRGQKADRLVSVSSPAAEKVVIHVSKMSDGVMKMSALDSLNIAPGEQVSFTPGGMHLMLMNLRHSLRKGEMLPLTVDFEHAGKISVSAPVMSPGAKGPS